MMFLSSYDYHAISSPTQRLDDINYLLRGCPGREGVAVEVTGEKIRMPVFLPLSLISSELPPLVD